MFVKYTSNFWMKVVSVLFQINTSDILLILFWDFICSILFKILLLVVFILFNQFFLFLQISSEKLYTSFLSNFFARGRVFVWPKADNVILTHFPRQTAEALDWERLGYCCHWLRRPRYRQSQLCLKQDNPPAWAQTHSHPRPEHFACAKCTIPTKRINHAHFNAPKYKLKCQNVKRVKEHNFPEYFIKKIN